MKITRSYDKRNDNLKIKYIIVNDSLQNFLTLITGNLFCSRKYPYPPQKVFSLNNPTALDILV